MSPTQPGPNAKRLVGSKNPSLKAHRARDNPWALDLIL